MGFARCQWRESKSQTGNAVETRQRRWNWKENIAEGLNRYHDKYTDFACKWQAILEASYAYSNDGDLIPYPTVAQIKDAIELTNRHNMDDEVYTMAKIYQMQAYNGVTGAYFIENITERVFTDSCDNTIMRNARIDTCWEYRPGSTGFFGTIYDIMTMQYSRRVLNFHPNSQHYIQRVNNFYRRAQ